MTRLGVFLLWLLHFLPFRALGWIGNALGSLLYVLAVRRRRIAAINLALCFPDMSDGERKRLGRYHFRMFARGIVERSILWWSSAARISGLIRVEGTEHFEALRRKPAILLTAHFVGMDVGAQWIAQRVDGVSIYSNQSDRYFNELLLKKRTRFGKQRLYSRQQGLRAIVRAVRKGYPCVYASDQDQGVKEGAFIPFFGVPAATITSVPRIAQLTGATVLPWTTRVLPGAEGYVLTFYPPWENYPSGDDIADTRRVNEFIEHRVREMPEQYFWVHRRFKTRPAGEAKLY
jgi:KDO2-lipid IV(A) lauroyltransferase